MQFCEDCGSLLTASEGAMVCPNCGREFERDEALAARFVSTERQREDDVVETSAEGAFEGKPTATGVTCAECGHDEAWYTIKQTASADEPPTRFFKCTRCGYRWREYS